MPPKDTDLDKIQYTLASKVGEERCVLPKCHYMGRHVTLAWQQRPAITCHGINHLKSFELVQLWIWMSQHKYQVCLLQTKAVWRWADHISLSGWYSNIDLVTVSETVQSKADHGWGPQCVQKHVTKRAAILNGSLNKVRISRMTFGWIWKKTVTVIIVLLHVMSGFSVIKPWLKMIPVKWYDIISLRWNDIISLHGLNCPIK